MMTGRYSWRQGFYFVGGQGQAVNESFTMLPEVLKAEGGYHTVAVGKCALTAAAASCCWLLHACCSGSQTRQPVPD
jgi:arylsulfatase A-like enzyme